MDENHKNLYHIAQNPENKHNAFLGMCQGYIELYDKVQELETIKKLFIEQNQNLYGGIGDGK